jgi:hypothetical protein
LDEETIRHVIRVQSASRYQLLEQHEHMSKVDKSLNCLI